MMVDAFEKAEAIRAAENHQCFLDGIAKVAKNMLKKGETIDRIKEYTGLSEAEISSLELCM